jgi:hypothetical protein
MPNIQETITAQQQPVIAIAQFFLISAYIPPIIATMLTARNGMVNNPMKPSIEVTICGGSGQRILIKPPLMPLIITIMIVASNRIDPAAMQSIPAVTGFQVLYGIGVIVVIMNKIKNVHCEASNSPIFSILYILLHNISCV